MSLRLLLIRTSSNALEVAFDVNIDSRVLPYGILRTKAYRMVCAGPVRQGGQLLLDFGVATESDGWLEALLVVLCRLLSCGVVVHLGLPILVNLIVLPVALIFDTKSRCTRQNPFELIDSIERSAFLSIRTEGQNSRK